MKPSSLHRHRNIRLARWLSILVVVATSATLTACYKSSYVPEAKFPNNSVHLAIESEYHDTTFNIVAVDQGVIISCARSSLVVKNAFTASPTKLLATDCVDSEHDLKSGDSLTLRFQLESQSISRTYDEKRHLSGKPKKIELLLMIKDNGKWAAKAYPFKIENQYEFNIPFAKG